MSTSVVSIGEAARQSGVKVPTVRFYEQACLLPSLPRSSGNRREYGPAEIARLAFIRHARELGFDLDAIRALLRLQDEPDHSCRAVDALAQTHLEAVDRRIASLVALRRELKRMIGACRHGRVAECRVLEVLADHGKCLQPRHAKDRMPSNRPRLREPARRGLARR